MDNLDFGFKLDYMFQSLLMFAHTRYLYVVPVCNRWSLLAIEHTPIHKHDLKVRSSSLNYSLVYTVNSIQTYETFMKVFQRMDLTFMLSPFQ